MSECVRATCVPHRRECYWNIQDAAWVHTDGWPCDPADPAIGNRVCKGCGAKLFDHCPVHGHWPPCCPGQCPQERLTPAQAGRLGGRPRRAAR